MRAITLLRELQSAGVLVTATSDGDLELDAPRGVLTKAGLATMRQHKAEIVSLLSPVARSAETTRCGKSNP